MRERVERLRLGDLMNEATLGKNLEEIGLVGAHRGSWLTFTVMTGLVPAIHVLDLLGRQDVDARHQAGHDESKNSAGVGITGSGVGSTKGTVGYREAVKTASLIARSRPALR